MFTSLKHFIPGSVSRFTSKRIIPENNSESIVHKVQQPIYKSLFNRSMFIDENYNIDIDYIRLAKKQKRLTFILSRFLPQNRNRSLANGSSWNCCCTIAASPSMDLRMSVYPQAM